MNFPRQFLGATLFMSALSSAACGSDTTKVVDNGKAVSSVEVDPNEETLAKGATLQFRAIVEYADGTSKDVTADPNTVWNTSDPAVATITKSGMVTTLRGGLVDISADYKGATGDEHFVVTP
jgi:uncharacterized protein YjdB